MPRKMAKKRRRTTPNVPVWVRKYLHNRIPPHPGTPEHDKFVGWFFFGEKIPGLPDDWREALPDWRNWDKRYE